MSASLEETLAAWETASSQDCSGPGRTGQVSEFAPVDSALKVDSADLALTVNSVDLAWTVNSEEYPMAASGQAASG